MKLIVGLGNPGKDYKNTRHNAGFLFIDELVKKFNLGKLTYNKKLLRPRSEAGEPRLWRENLKLKIVLAKPQTFMNKSGLAVAALAKSYKIKPKDILIIHDDIDIFWGAFKISFGRSSAGHKGVESIIKALKTKDFWRLRIGIQPTLRKHTPADKMILKKFTPQEIKALNSTIKKALTELENRFISHR